MTKRNFDTVFEQFNAAQMRADRVAERVYTWSMIAALAFAALCVGVALSVGVE